MRSENSSWARSRFSGLRERDRLKILHVIDSAGLYGAEVMLLNLMEEQARTGIEPILASIGEPAITNKEIEQEATRRGLRVVRFRMRPGPNLFGARQVLSFAWQEQIDMLHTHGYKGDILFGFLPRKIRRIPMVATVHGWTWTGGMTRMMVYEWLDSVSLARMDRVILVNEAMKDHRRLKNRSRLAVEVVPNGISVENKLCNHSKCDNLKPEIVDFCRRGFIIGAIGRLSPEKGFDLLLEAFAGLVSEGKDAYLVLLGDGGLRSTLERTVNELGLKGRVLMPGYVANARNYLPFFRVFVMPSLTEGLPIVLLEAMQAGVPIVASRVGGIPNVLEEGRAGLLVESGSAERLKQGIDEVLQNPTLAEQRVQAAGERLLAEYSSRMMAERYLSIYQSVLRSYVAESPKV